MSELPLWRDPWFLRSVVRGMAQGNLVGGTWLLGVGLFTRNLTFIPLAVGCLSLAVFILLDQRANPAPHREGEDNG